MSKTTKKIQNISLLHGVSGTHNKIGFYSHQQINHLNPYSTAELDYISTNYAISRLRGVFRSEIARIPSFDEFVRRFLEE